MAKNMETSIILTVVDQVSATLKAIGKQFDVLKRSANNIGTAFNNVGSAASNFTSKVRNIALMAGIAGGAVYALVKQQGAYAEMLQQTSEKTGFSTQSLQKWRYIAKLNNMELGDMVVGLRGLSKVMAHAVATPKDEMRAWFKKNNIAISDSKGKLLPLEQVMGNISEVFKNAPDGAAKMATAMKLLGKQGMNLIPILNLGKEGIARLMKEAEQYTFTLTPAMIKEQGAFDDALDRSGLGIEALKQSIASKLIPAMRPMIDKFNQWISLNREDIAKTISKNILEIGEGFKMVGGAIWWAGSKLAPFIEAIGGLKTVVAAVSGVLLGGLALSFLRLAYSIAVATKAVLTFGGAMSIGTFGFLAAAIGMIGFALHELWKDFDQTKAAWNQLWSQLPSSVQSGLRGALALITGGMSEIGIAISSNWESIKASFAKGGLSQVFADMFAGAKEKVSAAMQELTSAFSGWVEQIKGFFSPLTGILDSIVNGIMKIKSALAGGITGNVSINSSIPAGVSGGGIKAGSPAVAPNLGSAKTALNTTPTVSGQSLAMANQAPAKQHLDVYMKIDQQGRASVSAKSDKSLAFSSSTGKMV